MSSQWLDLIKWQNIQWQAIEEVRKEGKAKRKLVLDHPTSGDQVYVLGHFSNLRKKIKNK